MIGSLFRKKKNFKGLLTTIDLHSHLLPGIDDGVQSIEESLEVVEGKRKRDDSEGEKRGVDIFSRRKRKKR